MQAGPLPELLVQNLGAVKAGQALGREVTVPTCQGLGGDRVPGSGILVLTPPLSPVLPQEGSRVGLAPGAAQPPPPPTQNPSSFLVPIHPN